MIDLPTNTRKSVSSVSGQGLLTNNASPQNPRFFFAIPSLLFFQLIWFFGNIDLGSHKTNPKLPFFLPFPQILLFWTSKSEFALFELLGRDDGQWPQTTNCGFFFGFFRSSNKTGMSIHTSVRVYVHTQCARGNYFPSFFRSAYTRMTGICCSIHTRTS